jgi:hypothetical protein
MIGEEKGGRERERWRKSDVEGGKIGRKEGGRGKEGEREYRTLHSTLLYCTV